MRLRMSAGFEIVCEIEPPVSADLGIVREQIAILRPTCDAFLVPDNHLGRATVSSIAVAHQVEYLQGRAMACLNARDRNLLGLQRDLPPQARMESRSCCSSTGTSHSRVSARA